MYPCTIALLNGLANQIHSHTIVVVSTDRKHWRKASQTTNQLAELIQLGLFVNKIPSKQNRMRLAHFCRPHDLLAQSLAAPSPQMNITDIHQPACISSIRKTLFTY
jgi:hypothetical protein